jgi:hypothetical protein
LQGLLIKAKALITRQIIPACLCFTLIYKVTAWHSADSAGVGNSPPPPVLLHRMEFHSSHSDPPMWYLRNAPIKMQVLPSLLSLWAAAYLSLVELLSIETIVNGDVSCSHGGKYEDESLPGYSAV